MKASQETFHRLMPLAGQSCMQKISSRLWDKLSQYEAMSQCLRQVAVRLWAWVQITLGAKTLCSTRSFCVALNPSVHWRALLYCCTLYNFSFLGFCHGQSWSRADSVLFFNMNILLDLFWSTWSQALGQDFGHMCWPGAWEWLSPQS